MSEDDRLLRIENKVDDLTKIVTAHVAVEEAAYKRVPVFYKHLPLMALALSVLALGLSYFRH